MRRLVLALALTALAAAALLSVAATARAQVVTLSAGHEYGVQLQAGTASEGTPLEYKSGPVVHSNASYAIYWDPANTYAGWESLTSGFLEGVAHTSGPNVLSNVYAVATQYADASGKVAYSSSFRGAYTDVDPLTGAGHCTGTTPPALCVSDAQIRTELSKYISANGLPVGLNPSGGGPTPIYFVFTPPGTTVCLGATLSAGYCSEPGGTEPPLCSYHSFTTVNSNTVLYAVLPTEPVSPTTQMVACQNGTALEEPNKNPADVTVNEIADEQIATATDPLFNGWVGPSKEEVPDKCRYNFLPLNPGGRLSGEFWNNSIESNHYYLNDEFNQAALTEGYPGSPCLNTVTEEPEFTAPTPVHAGEPVTFNATASYVDLGIAKYNWEFGPGETAEVNCEGRTPTYSKTPAECNAASGTGNPNSVASVVHKYAHSGSYEVKLTVIDDGGNSAVATHTITVVPTQLEEEEAKANAKREAEEKATREAAEKANREAEEKAKSPAAIESAKRAAEAKAAAAVPAPVAAASVATTSLKTALSGGLTVRYSVNEQVTGSFEVLLTSSVARQIGLHGTPATGLPVGSAPQIIIAKAILVTTAGGHNTVKIQFGKKTAALLHKLHKVSLMVRLVVRNASSRTPVSTTVWSVVTLH